MIEKDPPPEVDERRAVLGTLCRPLDSNDIFRGTKEVFIRHGGQLYRLTITRNDKLILQK